MHPSAQLSEIRRRVNQEPALTKAIADALGWEMIEVGELLAGEFDPHRSEPRLPGKADKLAYHRQQLLLKPPLPSWVIRRHRVSGPTVGFVVMTIGSDAAFAFITVGASLKLALFPLHLWLPNAYTFAPSAISAFLAATATKVGVYVLLRFFFTVFGTQFSFGVMHAGEMLLPE